ncbi:TerC family protein [Campylobacter sp. MIT 97-5078]|uniref:TerC family protein n=1 Tax=Campylobacter sp. MIT 97-5078 TaxID=1548153 RepID=UPI00051319C6|nr:TerC family protein [Campylobacter sp. MIT 97-5078]KGI56601.1 membrane protein [Campylobacter sp. MIT 97-5078]TQR26791.1 TerC family protein [Campylobacter sp. MIT 97-5078]
MIESFEWIFNLDSWLTLATLAALEIVLGIDNIILLAILVNKLPTHQRDKTRYLGLMLAMLARIGLLFSLFWIMKLTAPLFNVYLPMIIEDNATLKSTLELMPSEISGRDLVLFFGGLFLIIKPMLEIVEQLKMHHGEAHHTSTSSKFWIIIAQIILLDIVFSLDSVITAVGIANNLQIMVIAIIIAVSVMLFASKPIADFVETYPSIKILALAFLIMVGVVLVAESVDLHIDKAYIYVAMIFSLVVEILNIILNKKIEHFKLKEK